MSMPVRGLAAVAVLCLLVSCSGSGSVGARPVDDIEVGLLAPLSGPDAALGAEQRRGAELAAEIVNDDHDQVPLPLAAGTGLPRLGGARIRLNVGDSAGTVEGATEQLDRIVDDLHPVALIGGDKDDVAAAVGQRSEEVRVPYLDAGSSAGYVADVGLDWYFRNSPSDRMLAASMVSLLTRESTGAIALAQPADGRHADLAAVVRELATDADVKVTVTVRTGSGVRGAERAAATLAREATGAVVLIAGTRAEAVALVQLLRVRKPSLPVFGLGPGFAALDFAGTAGSAGNRVLRPVAWSPEFASRNHAARVVDELYQRRFGAPMTAAAASAFTAVMTLATAIDGAAAREPGAVRGALRSADIPGARLIMPWVGVRFGAGGQNEHAAAIVEQIDGEKTHVVHPAELATAELAWPRRDRP